MNDIELIELDPHRDAVFVADWINSPGGVETLQLMGIVVPDDYETTVLREFETLKQIQNSTNELAWMIEYDGLVVGIVELHIVPFEGLQAPNISIMIGDISARGMGIGTYAMQYAIEHTRQLGHKVLYARVLTTNTASIRLIKKLGFTNDGESYIDNDRLCWQNVKLLLNP